MGNLSSKPLPCGAAEGEDLIQKSSIYTVARRKCKDDSCQNCLQYSGRHSSCVDIDIQHSTTTPQSRRQPSCFEKDKQQTAETVGDRRKSTETLQCNEKAEVEIDFHSIVPNDSKKLKKRKNKCSSKEKQTKDKKKDDSVRIPTGGSNQDSKTKQAKNKDIDTLTQREEYLRLIQQYKKLIKQDLTDSGLDGRISRGGVAFTLNFNTGQDVKMPPKRLTEPGVSKSEVHDYTFEEKALMAEIMRDSILAERSSKASRYDIKRFDAQRRRMVWSAEAEAKQQQQNQCDAAAAREMEERSKKMKELAVKTREARLANNKRNR